ncbi:NAD-dependent epimerase/dehydratase family protein [Amycolatopsis acidiphila]|nr:NAD(P)-dependent oxidoreductase [Amycolatopsis acidiphila]
MQRSFMPVNPKPKQYRGKTMVSIFITGGAGRIGSTLARKLVKDGFQVKCMVRPGDTRSITPGITRVEAALTDSRALARAIEGSDVVVHLAAQMPVGETPIDQYYDINVLGTLRVLEAAVNQSYPVKQFVYASTDNTYGPAMPEEDPITESHPQVPGDYYGTSKVLCEHLVRNYYKIHGLRYTILRYGSVIAPNEASSLFRLRWFRAFLKSHMDAGKKSNLYQLFGGSPDFIHALESQVQNLDDDDDDPPVRVTGADGRPWAIHLSDVRDSVSGTVNCLDNPNAWNETFNILGPATTTFAEGAEIISQSTGVETIELTMPRTLAFELSNEKARRLIGYEPVHDFYSTLSSCGEKAGRLDYVPVGAGWTAS